ncbi:MAG TPA: ammonium transporter [Candidatus Tumulicola sp.]|nr:ammonium transporter [Candidatus Tumulicola sp.]
MLKIDAGDTAWVLASTALVMLMTPAVGFFYGGLVRKKNVLATLMHSLFILCLISVQWALWGYTLAFGPDANFLGRFHGIIGGLQWLGLQGVGVTPSSYAPTVPHLAFAAFQMMFAAITPALITGGFAERKHFKAFVLFTLLWATLVYDPLAHWVWGQGGWLNKLGTLDFAGGTVVHISSGVSALIAALMLGRRLGFLPTRSTEPHDTTMVVLGAVLLWFGWFGFNAGSALSAGGLAANAFVATNLGAAMGALTWVTVSWWHKGHPSVIGAAAGGVAGLVAITPACGFVTPMGAILIGFGAGIVCYGAVVLRERMRRVDDSLDVWAVHGIGGTWGALATGLFATIAVNAAGANGLFYSNPKQLAVQALAVVVSWVYCAGMTWVILKGINMFVPLRVSQGEEERGLDVSQHAEVAYNL